MDPTDHDSRTDSSSQAAGTPSNPPREWRYNLEPLPASFLSPPPSNEALAAMIASALPASWPREELARLAFALDEPAWSPTAMDELAAAHGLQLTELAHGLNLRRFASGTEQATTNLLGIALGENLLGLIVDQPGLPPSNPARLATASTTTRPTTAGDGDGPAKKKARPSGAKAALGPRIAEARRSFEQEVQQGPASQRMHSEASKENGPTTAVGSKGKGRSGQARGKGRKG